VIACGRMHSHKLFEKLNRTNLSGDARSLNKKHPFKKFRRSQKKRKIKLHHKKTEQTHVALGFHTFGKKDSDRYASELLNIILGGNMSSRLFEELREKSALSYDISSSVRKYEETGAFTIHAGVHNNRVDQALRIIIKELSSVKNSYVTEDELERAKEYYKGQLLLALEDTTSRMLWLGDKLITKEGIPSVKHVLNEVLSIKKEDIKRITEKMFCTESISLAAIGPKDALKESRIKNILEL